MDIIGALTTYGHIHFPGHLVKGQPVKNQSVQVNVCLSYLFSMTTDDHTAAFSLQTVQCI